MATATQTQPKPQTQPDPRKVAIVERAFDRLEAQLAALGFAWSETHGGWLGPAAHIEAARKLGARRCIAAEEQAR